MSDSFSGKYAELPKMQNGKTCEWFALCMNITARVVTHPILGEVPICVRCFNKMKRVEN